MAGDGEKLKVLELYSGIGGMHFALQESRVGYEVVRAVDINPAACHVYRHNFPNTRLTEGLIEGAVSAVGLEKLCVDMIVMSPPCQPFTRMGRQRDVSDNRTNSFLYLLSLIPKLSKPPRYILVENVKGFEVSDARKSLVDMLDHCQYTYQELMLTPLQFNIPNSRLRYYLLAKRLPEKFTFSVKTHVLWDLPELSQNETLPKKKTVASYADPLSSSTSPSYSSAEFEMSQSSHCEYENQVPCLSSETTGHCVRSRSTQTGAEDSCNLAQSSCHCDRVKTCEFTGIREKKTLHFGNSHHMSRDDVEIASQRLRQRYDDQHKPYPNCLTVEHYLEQEPAEYFCDYLLSDSELKRFVIMDIVPPSARKTACFARRYGNFVEGGGSVVMMTTLSEAVCAASDLKSHRESMKESLKSEWDPESLEVLRALELRWFTPREMANLLCFPDDFSFPESITRKQKYKCLGNSLNVHVVSRLIQLLVLGATQ